MKKNIEDNKFNLINTENLDGVVLMEAKMYDFNFKKHMHEEFAIGVTRKGIQTFNCRGALHKVNPSGIMTFNPNDAHDGHAELESGLEYQMLYVREEQIDKVVQGICGETRSGFNFKETVQYNKELSYRLLDLFYTLSHNENNKLEVQEKFYDVISKVMIKYGDFSKEKMSVIRDNALVQNASNFIRENARENISLNDIANEVGVSAFYFSRLFKKTTGLSPHNFLNQCRISIIKDNIMTGIPLAELALKAGFTDQSHMNRRFKETMGLTPGQYKRILLG